MSDHSAYILLAEDDPTLGYLLKEYLSLKGFEVTWVKDGIYVMEEASKRLPDLCILDIMMPTMDGFQVAKLLQRDYKNLPFLFLSARSMKTDVLKGFQLGAEDYVKKPVDEEELLARVQAILKRSKGIANTKDQPITIGTYQFFPQKQALGRQGITVKLTRRESDLLHMLAKEKGKLVKSSFLLESLWGKDDFFARKSMDVYIHKLRKHLEADPSVQIANVHGRGFFLDAE